MNTEDREHFWRALCSIADTSAESMATLCGAIELPERICRFRSVSETSLLDLQNNTMRYSSADYYDDPFDTYFYINYETLKHATEQFNQYAFSNNGQNMRDFIRSWFIPEKEKEVILNKFDQQRQAAVPMQITEAEINTIKSIRRQVVSSLYSLCFCDDPLSEALWLKYGDCYRGFAQIYDAGDPNTFLCGKMEKCSGCPSEIGPPNLFPVCYSDERYDATRYALGLLALNIIPAEYRNQLNAIEEAIQDMLRWEAERISLIKKKCHEYDREWRLIYPLALPVRPSIGMKPSSIVLGFRMPEYKRRLVVSAATVAGIESINELYIDEKDNLSMRPLGKEDAL